MLTLGFLRHRCMWKETLSCSSPWSTSDLATWSEGQEYFRLLTWIWCNHFHMKAITWALNCTDYFQRFWGSICSLLKIFKNNKKATPEKKSLLGLHNSQAKSYSVLHKYGERKWRWNSQEKMRIKPYVWDCGTRNRHLSLLMGLGGMGMLGN